MLVKQISELMNTVSGEVLGKTDLVSEDLSNVVDMGNEIFNASSVDAYVKSLVNHIGKMIFVNRKYRGSVPSVLMDAWEFGSVLEKVQAELPEATENESWELENGASYDPNIFYKPTVTAKFFNSKVTFEIPMSFTEMQVKQSFSSAEQLNGFLSMLYNAVERSITLKTDSLIMRTINNFIAETVYNEYTGTEINTKSGVRAINLLKKYNDANNSTLTATDCLNNPDFIRYAAFTIGLVSDRMESMSTLFNIGGKARFTPKDMQHIVFLSDFARSADVYLQSDTFHNEYTRLPKAEIVPFWQGTGEDYDFASVSTINVKTSNNNSQIVSGVLGCIFDRDALGVCNLERRVTSNYNPKAEFYNNWFKFDAGYFNDTNENFVVFFVA